VSRLLIFGSFAYDPQGVLAAVDRLAIVSIECGLNRGIRPAKLRTATFTDGKGGIPFHDSEFALWHEDSLAPNACVNEKSPVPDKTSP
jgi:hypothetical protein